MYFNNDIKINKFINRSDFNNYLNCMFRTDSSQKLTNEYTPENECYTMDNPEDTGVFQLDLKARKAVKNGFFDQWNHDVDHLFFARVECPRDDFVPDLYFRKWDCPILHMMTYPCIRKIVEHIGNVTVENVFEVAPSYNDLVD